MLASMGAAGWRESAGTDSVEAVRPGVPCWVVFELSTTTHGQSRGYKGYSKWRGRAHMSILPLSAWPLMRRRHASLHSCTISVAYFLFLASPLNANWFSGFPSGIWRPERRRNGGRKEGQEGAEGGKGRFRQSRCCRRHNRTQAVSYALCRCGTTRW